MILDKDFPEFERLVAVADSLTTKSKKGALIGICDGIFYMTNDGHTVAVKMPSKDKDNADEEDIAFRSHVVPNMIAPIEVETTNKDVIFNWKENNTDRSHRIPKEKGVFDEIMKAFDVFDMPSNSPRIPQEALKSISDDVSVLEIEQESSAIVFKQVALTGEEEMEARVELAEASSGLGDFFTDDKGEELDECSVKVSTKDFKTIPKLTDNEKFQMQMNGDDSPVHMLLRVGSLKAEAIIGHKIHEV